MKKKLKLSLKKNVISNLQASNVFGGYGQSDATNCTPMTGCQPSGVCSNNCSNNGCSILWDCVGPR